MSSTQSIHPFGGENPQSNEALASYSKQGRVENYQDVESVLRRRIQHVEESVCANILDGCLKTIRPYHYTRSAFRKSFRATPKGIRSRDTRTPLTEARNWTYFFCKHALGLSVEQIGELYCRTRSTVNKGVLTIERALSNHEGLAVRMQQAANVICELDGVDLIDVRELGRAD